MLDIKEREEFTMEAKDYIVTKIQGEYAYLAEEGAVGGEELFIALALLPLGVDVGTRLHFENFEFCVI